MSRDLPKSANLEHLKKQAKALQRELRQRDPETRLSEAQHAIAREYGFASWTKLKAHVESLPPEEATLEAAAGMLRGGGRGGGDTPAGTDDPPAFEDSPGGGHFDRFTEKARRVVSFARHHASRRGSGRIETTHLLLGLIQEDRKLLDRVLGDGSSIDEIEQEIDRRAVVQGSAQPLIGPPLSGDSKQMLTRAIGEADRLRHKGVASGHLLLGLLGVEGSVAANVLSEVLARKGETLAALRHRVEYTLHVSSFLNEPEVRSAGPLGSHGSGGMFHRYTEPARRTLFFARHEASQFGSTTIETEHLLLGLIREDPDLARRALGGPSGAPRVRNEIERRLTVAPRTSTSSDLPLSVECRRILERASEEADRGGDEQIRPPHLLLGFLGPTPTLALSVLDDIWSESGMGRDAAHDAIVRFLTERGA